MLTVLTEYLPNQFLIPESIGSNNLVERVFRVFNGIKGLEEWNKRTQSVKSSRYPKTGNSIISVKPHWLIQGLISFCCKSAAGDRVNQGPGFKLLQPSEEPKVLAYLNK